MMMMNSNTSSCVIFNGDEYMVVEILSRLPVRSLLRFKCVSKRWCSLIQDPNFVDLHSARSITRPGATFFISTDIVGRNITFVGSTLYDGPHFHTIDYVSFISDVGGHERFGPFYYQEPESFIGHDKLRCTQILNGLLLMGFNQETVWILNPSTRKTILLTKTNIEEEEAINNKDNDDDQHYNWMNKDVQVNPKYAFGFDPVTKKYKVICICEVDIWYVHPEMFLHHSEDQQQGFFRERLSETYLVCMVLTIEEEENCCYWRRMDEIPPYNILLHNCMDPPLYLNGALYWRKIHLFKNPLVEAIVVFDVSSEKFSVIRIPNFILKPALHQFGDCYTQKLKLYEVDGCLAILENVNTTGGPKPKPKLKPKPNPNPNTIEIWKLVVAAAPPEAACRWVKETILTLSFDWRKRGYLFEVIGGTTNKILLKLYTERGTSICYYDRDDAAAAENKTMKKKKKKQQKPKTSCEMLEFTGECASFTGIRPFPVRYNCRDFQTCTETLWSL